MMIFRLSTWLTLGGAVAAGALLFWTSQSVQQSENRLRELRQAVMSEQQAIRVLRAEWDYLNRPDRLEFLAAEHLGLSSSDATFNVSDDPGALPDPFVPVLPQHKPAFSAQPVNFEGGGE